MEATLNLNIPVDVPNGYSLETLKKQVTEYAKSLIAKAKTTKQKHYEHESLRGLFAPANDQELLEEYLEEKYHV